MRSLILIVASYALASVFPAEDALASAQIASLPPSNAEAILPESDRQVQAEYFATVRFEQEAQVELASSGRVTYTVAPGDTLGKIAQKYGVTVAAIRKSNGLKSDQIFVGQKLHIRSRSAAGSQERIVHSVRSGETGGKIAQRYRVSLSQLRQWNPSVNLDRLSIGQKLVVYTELGDGGSGGGGDAPRASGDPSRGRLIGGVQLEAASGLLVRNAERAFGMPVTVDAIKMAYGRMNAHFAEQTAVLVGDLSLRNGGVMRPHRSHQNGLDADIAYLTTDCINTQCDMRDVTADEVDVPRQWYVFEDWLRADVVEFIFVPYSLQERMFEFAKARGADDRELAQWFQYPNGKHARSGVIRNWSGHNNHYHVRFKNNGD